MMLDIDALKGRKMEGFAADIGRGPHSYLGQRLALIPLKNPYCPRLLSVYPVFSVPARKKS